MSKNALFEEVEKLLKKSGFEKVEQDKSYMDFKDKDGNYVKFFYSEGINWYQDDLGKKVAKKRVSKG